MPVQYFCFKMETISELRLILAWPWVVLIQGVQWKFWVTLFKYQWRCMWLFYCPLQTLQALQGSPGSSISGDDVALDSDVGDPVHDDSILEELFYKNVRPSDCNSQTVACSHWTVNLNVIKNRMPVCMAVEDHLKTTLDVRLSHN